MNVPVGGSSSPLYQTATFAFEDGGEYDYTRSGNPTRTQLESVMADLEGATRSFAFTSGMAALTVAMRLVPSGGHIVTGDDLAHLAAFLDGRLQLQTHRLGEDPFATHVHLGLRLVEQAHRDVSVAS
mgnify:CR=1 FL=1